VVISKGLELRDTAGGAGAVDLQGVHKLENVKNTIPHDFGR
jgi:hypothetical protein